MCGGGSTASQIEPHPAAGELPTPTRVAAAFADLRCRVAQAQALVAMLELRSSAQPQLLPLLRDALDMPPISKHQGQAPVAAAVRNAPRLPPSHLWSMPTTAAEQGFGLDDIPQPVDTPPPRPYLALRRYRYDDTDAGLPKEHIGLLQDLADGVSFDDAAQSRFMSHGSVKARMVTIASHLGSKGVGQLPLVVAAFRRGLID